MVIYATMPRVIRETISATVLELTLTQGWTKSQNLYTMQRTPYTK